MDQCRRRRWKKKVCRAGKVLGLPDHSQRSIAIGEVHARPHPLLSSPRLLIQLSSMTDGGSSVDGAVLAELRPSPGCLLRPTGRPVTSS